MGKYDKAMMKTAHIWAKESYCKKRQVGCVISKDGRINSIGYNGTIANDNNECEEYVTTCFKCGGELKIDYPGPIEVVCECGGTSSFTEDFLEEHKDEFIRTKKTVVHAEQNALMFAVKNGISTDGATMYVTTAPCVHCAKLIIQAGIVKVVYEEDYSDSTGIELLKSNIDVVKLEDDN